MSLRGILIFPRFLPLTLPVDETFTLGFKVLFISEKIKNKSDNLPHIDHLLKKFPRHISDERSVPSVWIF